MDTKAVTPGRCCRFGDATSRIRFTWDQKQMFSDACRDPFPSTRWSLVVAAGGTSNEKAHEALELLCQAYWLPVYGFVRRWTPNVEDARDLTQGFFARLLEGQLLRLADPSRGRFRCLLLTAVRNFLAQERERGKALKRGGGQSPIPIDIDQGDALMEWPATEAVSPDLAFDRQWGIALLNRVLDRLESEFECAGKKARFEGMKSCLTEAGNSNYDEIARRLGGTSSAMRVAVHRMRNRYRELLLEEIAQTVDDPSEVASELAELFRIFSGSV